MFKKCIALLTASVLLLTPMTAGAVTWGDIMTGIHTTGSFSGGGTTAVKENDTITVSGGEVEFRTEDYDASSYNFIDEIDESGNYMFEDVAFVGKHDLAIIGNGSTAITFGDTVDFSGISGVIVNLRVPESSVHIENNATITSGERVSAPISVTLDTDGHSSFSMSGSGTLDSVCQAVYVYMPVENVDFENVDAFISKAEESIKEQLDLESIQQSQVLLVPDGFSVGNYMLHLHEDKVFNSAYQVVFGDLDLTATSTATPAPAQSATPVDPEQPTSTPTPEQPDTTPAPEQSTTPAEPGQPTATPAPETTPEPTPAPEQEDNGPSEEQIRHEMEMKRQEEAVGGITGSPYWCSQLFLNYHSRNLWLHDAEGRKTNFREHISWEGEYPNKRLLLRVNNMASTDGLTMRFDEETLNAFDKSGIVTVILANTVNGQVEPFMQYSVSDLRAAREQYGLAPEELLVVGGMDDEVMKSAIGGTPVPVE